MNIIVIYHSGAGSTKYIAELFRDTLQKIGHCVDISAIENYKNVNFEGYDGVVIGFPTYHASPSFSASKFMEAMSVAENKLPMYIFTTCGWYSETAYEYSLN